MFSIGCGSCYDLTHDGANLWLNGITPQAADDVHFYTTQYKDGGLVNYCNLAANLLLKWYGGSRPMKFHCRPEST